MKTGTIHQEVKFKATALQVYKLLMEAETHSAFTGDFVNVDENIGTKFEVFGGYCKVINRELELGKKIVQDWFFREEDVWPEDHYSNCIFQFEDVEDGCLLTFDQSGIPIEKVEDLTNGWVKYYWEPMAEFLAK